MKIIAKFHPQAWVNDTAIEVDPEGETEFDVTDYILAISKEGALSILDDDYDSDDLRFTKHAPEWVKEWQGPFYIEVAAEIARFFEEEDV